MKRQFSQTALKLAFVCFLSSVALVATASSSHASKYPQPLNADMHHANVPQATTDADGNHVLKGDARKIPDELDGVGVHEHLGASLDLENLEFRSAEDGQNHKLKDFFHSGKPTVLNLVYFQCPMLCTMVLNGVTEGMKGLDWKIGQQFDVITISIDPTDNVESARAKKQVYVEQYLKSSEELLAEGAAPKGTPAPIDGAALANVNQHWHFFTGTESEIKKLADQLGFQFKYDSIQKQFAHPAVTFILTPDGKISRNLYGITYRPRDLRLALLEAARGKIGTVFDRLLMFCYHYEPNARGYTLQATRVMQAGGAGTLVFFGGYLTLFWTRQRKGKKK